MFKKSIFLLLIVIVVCVFICIYSLLGKELFNYSTQNVVFTCTTFFDCEKQDKWTPFCNAMDSILSLHSRATLDRIGLWLVINEYSDRASDWKAKVNSRYPFILFIQKEKDQKGQAVSLNLILDAITPYKYWIQWEESWYPERECLSRALLVLESTDITQIQMNKNIIDGKPEWLEHTTEFYFPKCYDDYCSINYTKIGKDFINSIEDARTVLSIEKHYLAWPLYSLRPSINRVSHYRALGYFNTSPDFWPFIFEWEYGRRFVNAGCKKAILKDGPVVRSKEHKSTY